MIRPSSRPWPALAALLLTPLLAGEASALDGRFRTFGEVSLQGTTLPYRTGDAGPAYVPGQAYGGDYLTVGTIDYRWIGPYAGLDPFEVWKRWTFLRRRRGAALDRPLYEWLVKQLGAEAGGLYQEDVLEKQIAAERGKIKTAIENFIRGRRTSPSGGLVNEPIVFEIGNEPNVFPLMSADLYAWYYLRWRQIILAEVADLNRNRAPHERIAAHFMPGGLWTFEGLPAPVLRALSLRLRLGTLTLAPGVETSTRRYHESFLSSITSERYAALGSGTYRTRSITVRIPLIGRVRLQQRVFVPAAPRDLVDVGNLHFYPYIHRHSTYGEGRLDPHVANLKALADFMAANAGTGRVWITELGNVNPYDDGRAARDVMTPVCTALRAGAIPAIDRWYWFKARGETSFDPLVRVPSLPRGRLLRALTPRDLVVLDDLARDYRGQAPAQGLTDERDQVRTLGVTYLNLASSPAPGRP